MMTPDETRQRLIDRRARDGDVDHWIEAFMAMVAPGEKDKMVRRVKEIREMVKEMERAVKERSVETDGLA